MGHPLRDRNTPKALAEARQSFDFKEQLSTFERLREVVENDLRTLDEKDRPAGWLSAGIHGSLEFGFADLTETVAAVTGDAGGTIDAVCQRCLEPFPLPLAVTIRYLLPGSGTAAETTGPDGFEVWEMPGERLRPLDLVEETLIMALPLSAAHATRAECGPLANRFNEAPSDATRTTRPFADLKSQLTDGNE